MGTSPHGAGLLPPPHAHHGPPWLPRRWDSLDAVDADAPTDLAALLAELDRLRGKLADAWDEGFEAGEANENSIYWSAVGTGVTNPYRKDQS